MCSIFVLKSIYDYNDPKDPKILTFDVNERFILIKDPDGTDWFYVINTFGKIGYVPNSYVQFEEVSALFIDSNANIFSSRI